MNFTELLDRRVAPAAAAFASAPDDAPDGFVLARDGAALTLSENGAVVATWDFAEVDALALRGSTGDLFLVDLV